MNRYNRSRIVSRSLAEIDLAIVVNCASLRDIFVDLNSVDERWWIASTPVDSVETGYMTIGHRPSPRWIRGSSEAADPVFFRIPVLNTELPKGGSKELLLLIHPYSVIPVHGNYFLEEGQTLGDMLNGLSSCFPPLLDTLIKRLVDRRSGRKGNTEASPQQQKPNVAEEEAPPSLRGPSPCGVRGVANCFGDPA